MADMNALEADLQAIFTIADEHHSLNLVKKKEFLDKLTNGQFDEVIRELFTGKKIIKFLNKSAIEVGVVLEEDVIKASVSSAATIFKLKMLDKISCYENKANQKSSEQMIGDAIIKYGKKDGQEDVADMKVFKYIGDQVDEHSNDYLPVKNDPMVEPDKFTIIDSYQGQDEELSCTIDGEGFNQWASEHFLVKSEGEGMASFDLNY